MKSHILSLGECVNLEHGLWRKGYCSKVQRGCREMTFPETKKSLDTGKGVRLVALVYPPLLLLWQ